MNRIINIIKETNISVKLNTSVCISVLFSLVVNIYQSIEIYIQTLLFNLDIFRYTILSPGNSIYRLLTHMCILLVVIINIRIPVGYIMTVNLGHNMLWFALLIGTTSALATFLYIGLLYGYKNLTYLVLCCFNSFFFSIAIWFAFCNILSLYDLGLLSSLLATLSNSFDLESLYQSLSKYILHYGYFFNDFAQDCAYENSIENVNSDNGGTNGDNQYDHPSNNSTGGFQSNNSPSNYPSDNNPNAYSPPQGPTSDEDRIRLFSDDFDVNDWTPDDTRSRYIQWVNLNEESKYYAGIATDEIYQLEIKIEHEGAILEAETAEVFTCLHVMETNIKIASEALPWVELEIDRCLTDDELQDFKDLPIKRLELENRVFDLDVRPDSDSSDSSDSSNYSDL